MTSQARTQVYRYQLLSKNALSPEETELYELTHLAGVVMDPNIFKILLELIQMNVAPTAIERMLKMLVSQQLKKQSLDASDHTMENIPPNSSSTVPSSASSMKGRSVNRSRTDRNK